MDTLANKKIHKSESKPFFYFILLVVFTALLTMLYYTTLVPNEVKNNPVFTILFGLGLSILWNFLTSKKYIKLKRITGK